MNFPLFDNLQKKLADFMNRKDFFNEFFNTFAPCFHNQLYNRFFNVSIWSTT